MASRKRPTPSEERQEWRDVATTSSPAARKRRTSRGDAPHPAPAPRMVSVAVLPAKGDTVQITSTKPATSDAAHVSASSGHVARLSVRQCFGELRTALSEGWEIVQPIFARPLWSAADNSTTAFSFVLRREQATRLVTVPEGRTVQRFIRDRELTVDYRR
jgi:hypothetical protein